MNNLWQIHRAVMTDVMKAALIMLTVAGTIAIAALIVVGIVMAIRIAI